MGHICLIAIVMTLPFSTPASASVLGINMVAAETATVAVLLRLPLLLLLLLMACCCCFCKE